MVDTLIRLFPADAETFTTLGLGAIPDAISCDVQEVVNGSYELRMVYPEDGIRIDDIALKNIIYCKPQPHKNPQPFDIYKIVKVLAELLKSMQNTRLIDCQGFPCRLFLRRALRLLCRG